MTCGSQLSPPKQGDLEGLHIIAVLHLSKREKDLQFLEVEKACGRIFIRAHHIVLLLAQEIFEEILMKKYNLVKVMVSLHFRHFDT